MLRSTKIPIIFLFVLVIFPSTLNAQDYHWWNEKHQWDGISHWSKYMTNTARYMGPNALPVPEISTGRMNETPTLKAAADGHYSSGDQTVNTFAALFIPVGNKAGLRLQAIPFEFFQTDTLTRDMRAARDEDGKGQSLGDIYISTFFQVIKNHPTWPDILLGIHLKTATGDNLSSARNTDAPGYYFDLSFGKTFSIKNDGHSIRPFAVGGFYAYQTYHESHYQNDCFLYGLGLEWNTQKSRLTSTLGGYYGYFRNGDQPLVFRLKFERTVLDKWNPFIQIQQGLVDYPFTSIRIGIGLPINKWISPKQ